MHDVLNNIKFEVLTLALCNFSLVLAALPTQTNKVVAVCSKKTFLLLKWRHSMPFTSVTTGHLLPTTLYKRGTACETSIESFEPCNTLKQETVLIQKSTEANSCFLLKSGLEVAPESAAFIILSFAVLHRVSSDTVIEFHRFIRCHAGFFRGCRRS